MRIAASAIATCLLFSYASCVWAQTAGASAAMPDMTGNNIPARRPAIQEITIDNRGDDAVIVVFSRPSERTPFHHASRLQPGGRAVVPVPNLPSLRASVLRRNEVKRAARNDGQQRKQGDDRGADKDVSQRNLRLLGSILGNKNGNNNRNNGNNRNNNDRAAAPRDDRYNQQGGNNSQQGSHDNRYDDYGQNADGRSERETADINDQTYHLVLGNMLGTVVGDTRGNLPARDDQPGETNAIDADEGPGVRIVNGVAITVATGNAEGVEEDPDIAGAGTSIAISNDPAPANAAPPAPAPTCYCGPDMTLAYVEALRRARDRIEALPDRDTGLWDAAWWLSNNGSSIDEIVRPARKPGQAGMVGAEILCPSGPCAKLPGTGNSGTSMLFGVCMPKHVGNDIMYGLVTHLLGFRFAAQALGGHWAQYNSAYPSWDPPQSRAAYAIGSAIASLEGEDLTVDNAAERFHSAEMLGVDQAALSAVITASRGKATLPFASLNAVHFIQYAYPALADCQRCPADATEPGTILRDWSKSAWNSNDGSKTYPPGWKPEDDQPAGDEGQ